jgi:cell division septation protein DedD
MLSSASPIGPAYNVAKIVGNVVAGKQTVGEALTQVGSAALASKLGVSSSVLTKAINGDFGGAAQAFVTGKLSSSISKATGLPGALVSSVLKDADINKGTASKTSVTNGFSKTLDGILGTGKEPLSQDKLQTIANFDASQIAALNPDISEEEEIPYFIEVTGGATKDVAPDFDVSKLPSGTDLATQEDRDNGLASYDAASNAWVVNAAAPITGSNGQNTITDSGLPVNPNVGGTTITGNRGQNTIADSGLPVNPNVGGDTTKPIDQVLTDAGLVTDGGYLDPVTIIGKLSIDDLDVERNPYDTQKTDNLIPLEEAKPLPDNTVTEVIADTPTPVTPTPATPTPATPTPATPTPATPTPKTPVTPAEQFYQTTTQSNPTTLADIKYYLDMASGGMVPPENPSDPLESLLNQPMSVEELLYHLRS